MKKISISIIFFSLFICSCHGQLIQVNSKNQECSDYFIISENVEPSKKHRMVLSSYLYEGLVDEGVCNQHDGYEAIFNRESFEKTILLLFLDSSYSRLNHFKTQARWEEQKINLLNNCSDTFIRHKLVDSLLYYGRGDVMLSLWVELDVVELENLNSFISKLKESHRNFELANLAVICHNSKNFELRDSLMHYLNLDSNFANELKSLKSLMIKYVLVPHDIYFETLYGGY